MNNRLETSVPGVWALGDVKGGPAFTHISFNDFQIVYANLVDGKALTTDNRPVPYAVFTDPQLGRVGLTEREARAEGRRLKVGKIPMAWVARAIERDETAGLMKLVVDATTERVVGCHIVGDGAAEMVQVLGIAVKMKATKADFDATMALHPTAAEELVTMRTPSARHVRAAAE